jgi:predicted amidophosphoribosyltransferase
VDDVMTSGATLSAATDACLAAGSGPVYVVALARVAKDT